MKILDCTLRDGGYTNNWNFTKEQVIESYTACKNAGVKYCELVLGVPNQKKGLVYGIIHQKLSSMTHSGM